MLGRLRIARAGSPGTIWIRPLAAALDDARSLSLFASRRVIWIGSAEAVLPRGGRGRRIRRGTGTQATRHSPPICASLRRARWWCSNPAATISTARIKPGSSGSRNTLRRFRRRWSFARSRRKRRGRWRRALAKQAGLQMGLAELALLLDATGGDASRIAVEIEKLNLYAGGLAK